MQIWYARIGDGEGECELSVSVPYLCSIGTTSHDMRHYMQKSRYRLVKVAFATLEWRWVNVGRWNGLCSPSVRRGAMRIPREQAVICGCRTNLLRLF